MKIKVIGLKGNKTVAMKQRTKTTEKMTEEMKCSLMIPYNPKT